ncbi:hydrogenase iron-sulfur subunit [Chloroflexota bacterium]
MLAEYKPKIIGFLCNWCSYAGADMAGTSRMCYPSNIRIVRVPCSGRVDPILVVKCFIEGADGVLIAGCHPGDCHYSEGNYYTRRRFAILRELLEFMGIERDRLGLEWISAAEGKRFSDVVSSFTEAVTKLVPRNVA